MAYNEGRITGGRRTEGRSAGGGRKAGIRKAGGRRTESRRIIGGGNAGLGSNVKGLVGGRTSDKRISGINMYGMSSSDEPRVSEDLIYGRNPVIEALKAGRTLNKVFLLKDARMPRALTELLNIAKTEKNTIIQEVEKEFLDKLTFSALHQGVAAYASPVTYVEVDDILKKAEEKKEKPFILILDGIEDPHNLGAILRTAECFGVHGVIIPKRRAVALSSTVAKASSGAIEYIPVARVTNVSQTIKELKEAGLWIAGTAMGDDAVPLYKAELNCPIAIVIGAEGEGISRLASQNCDFLINIPMKGQIQSLNASAAAAIIIYEVVKQRM